MRPRHKTAGFTLVEIMIAMTLGLLLMAGAYAVFESTHRTERMNNVMSRIQENARFVQGVLSREIRMAGASDCGSFSSKKIYVTASTIPSTFGQPGQAIHGVNNVGAGNTYGARPGTDVLTIQGMTGQLAHIVGNFVPNNSNIKISNDKGHWHAGDVALVTDCSMGHLFAITNSPNGNGNSSVTLTHASDVNTTPHLDHVYDQNATVGVLQSETYYVAKTGKTAADGTPEYALYRAINGASANPLVIGVSNFQVLFGVDTTPGNGIDSASEYVPASQVTDWTMVRSVRVEATLRSTKAYVGEGLQAYPMGLDSPDRRLKYLVYTTAAIRGRVK